MRPILAKAKEVWQRSMLHRALLVAPPVVLLLWAGYVSVGPRSSAQYFTAKVEKGDVSQIVQATGTINPLITVAVGSVLSGNVVKINVDFNSQVKKGDLIAQIDPVPFQMKVAQSEADYQNSVANVASLEAQIETARANVANAKANIAKAQAALDDAQTQLRRIKELADQGVLAPQQKDTAQATYDGAIAGLHSAQAQETQSEAQLKTTIAQRDQAKAQVQMKKAAMDSARLDLDYCQIRAPIDGTVISRSVDVGQTVAASLQAPIIFTIAEDLRKMKVDTNVAESDVGGLQDNMEVYFNVDAYPGQKFKGKIGQIRNAAQTVQNVVTYDAVIEVDNNDLKLRPGMTANTTIVYSERDHALSVPNAALRFRPPDLPDAEPAPPPTPGEGRGGGAASASAAPAASASGRPSEGPPVPRKHARAQGSKQEGGQAKTVWVLRNGAAVPVTVQVGLSDGTWTEIKGGDLAPGDEAIVDATLTGSGTPAPARSAGGLPRGGRLF